MDLGYLNSKVRAWKGKLLLTCDYKNLLEVSDSKELAERLLDTPYGMDMEEVMERLKCHSPGKLLNMSLKNNLLKMHRMLWRSTPGKARLYLEAVLAPFDIQNIKTIMRGIENNVDTKEVFDVLVPSFMLDEKILRELSKRRDLRKMVSLLDTWGMPYAKPLKSGFEIYKKAGKISSLEMELDKFMIESYFNKIDGSNENGMITRSYLSRKADIYNIINALKMTAEGLKPPQASYYFIEGGTFGRDSFSRLLDAKNEMDFLNRVPLVLTKKDFVRALKMSNLANPQLLETLLNRIARRCICRYAIVKPLSIAVPICFILKKYAEVERLRIIESAVRFEMPENEIRSIMDVYE